MTISDRKLEPGTRLIGKHKRQEHVAEVIAGEDGKPCYRLADGRLFKSPSAAGKAVTGIACNGWRFWSLAGAEPDKAAADGAEAPSLRPTSPDTQRMAGAAPRPCRAQGRPHGADSAPGGQAGAGRQGQGQEDGAQGVQAHGQGQEALTRTAPLRVQAGACGRSLSLKRGTAHDGGIVRDYQPDFPSKR